MSEALRISSKEVKGWLERETSSVFIPVHRKAQNLLNEMKRTLENIIEVCKMLLENSTKEIEKRNRKTYGKARGLNKLAKLFLKRIRQIKIPENVSYGSFRDFVDETRKAFVVTEVDIRNWFPRISPFFMLDRRKFLVVFEKAKRSLKELQDFLTKEYVKTKTLEDTFHHIDNLMLLEGRRAELETHQERKAAEKASIERKVAETQQKMADLRSRENLTRLDQISTEIQKLRNEVKHNLRHLRKPFIKFQSRVFRKGGLTPEELEKLNSYIKNPFDAFAAEKAGYPMLKQILKKLADSIAEEKLKLKRRRKRKAEEDMDSILHENSLDTLHQRCCEALMQKKQLSTSVETTKMKENVLKLQEKLKKLERRNKRVESEESTIKRNLMEISEKIHDKKNEIEKNIFDFADKKILIEV